MYEIRLVCEGPTDCEFFRAVLDATLHGQDYQLTVLQPDQSLYGGDAGPHGGGWKGVRSWCRDVASAGGVEKVGAITPSVKLLVIHVDADVAAEPEHRVSKPCPPPEPTIDAVTEIVLNWLGDVEQVLAYAAALGCPEAVLVYPAAIPRPLDDVIGASGVRVRQLSLDLGADLDRAVGDFVAHVCDEI